MKKQFSGWRAILFLATSLGFSSCETMDEIIKTVAVQQLQKDYDAELILSDPGIHVILNDYQRAAFFHGASLHHTGTLDVAREAADAGVPKLVLTHITPPTTNNTIKTFFVEGMNKIYKGEIILGEDDMDIYLPPLP